MLLIALLTASCASFERDPVRDRGDLEGRSLAQVMQRLGSTTDYDKISRASDLGGEFYSPINARFPLSDPASHHVLIREVRWTRGDRYIAVFCTRHRDTWRVFDAVEWEKGVMF